MLFTPATIGNLKLENRLVRSATAERMADAQGKPLPQLAGLLERLACGGVGLIVSGHLYIHPTGRAHAEMTGIYADELIPDLKSLTDAVHAADGKIVAQLNHAGMHSNAPELSEKIAPSTVSPPYIETPARAMTIREIDMLIDAFAQAARRAQRAGFDGVQIHGAHGYLVSQFLSPYINRRSDEWGGSFQNRLRFLSAVARAIRVQVGPEYPVLIKLGMMDGIEGGLTLVEGAQVVAQLAEIGVDGIEISSGLGGKKLPRSKGIRKPADEAYFLPFARAARPLTNLPLILVGGFRSLGVMQQALQSGLIDFISICRPLINDPEFPNKLRIGTIEQSACISANNCWPKNVGDGVACRCPLEKISS